MSDFTIYHNPRCSKSRQTLALLEENGVAPTIIEYLNTPLDAGSLRNIASLLDVPPREMMRTKEDPYKENNLAQADDETLISAIVTHPILLERPIVVKGDRAVIGRPPENVLALIG